MAGARRTWAHWKRVVVVTLIVAMAALAVPDAGAPGVGYMVVDTFEAGGLKGWLEQRYNGRTLYKVVSEGQNKMVMAQSRASASALGKLVRFDPHRFSHLEWRWKIEDTIAEGSGLEVEANDHAAGVYVVFAKRMLPWKMQVIKYLWANTLPQGAVASHPTEDNIRAVAVESGNALARKWVHERRNLVEDYRNLFGGDPPRVVAIAMMTDSDHTRTQATAYYDDFILRR